MPSITMTTCKSGPCSHPNPSSVRWVEALNPKDLMALKDAGLPGYRATLQDLGRAMYVTIYLERLVPGPSGTIRRIALPPVFCQVHHNRLSQHYLCLKSQIVGTGNSPPPYLIGDGPLGAGIPLPGVRLKMVLITACFPNLRRLP